MYRRPKFLDALLEIRREMAGEANNDVAAYVELVRTGLPASARKTICERENVCGVERSVDHPEPVLEGRS